MSLSTFIRKNEEAILTDWEEFAQAHIGSAKEVSMAELRNHLRSILKFVTDDMDSFQKDFSRFENSGSADQEDPSAIDLLETYDDLHFIEAFDAEDLIVEFHALRASVIRLWEGERGQAPADYHELVKFNESVDEACSEGFIYYTEKVDHARNLLLASLVHDIRNPLGILSVVAQKLKSRTDMDDREKMLTEQIFLGATRCVDLVSDLIDDVRARSGNGLPVIIHDIDLEDLIEKTVTEIQIVHPLQKISVWAEGNLKGSGDKARLGQVLSHLILNAIQHGQTSTLIEVAAKGEEEEIIISVHNYGVPIPPAIIPDIFEAMTQGSDYQRPASATSSLGMGLFIVREIVEAHDGEIDVTSTEDAGTTFTLHIPRKKTP